MESTQREEVNVVTPITHHRKIIAFVRLGRPHFLVGGFVMHSLGVAAALYAGARLNVAALLLGQVAITATQWMVHYSNEYFDLAADRANRTPTAWSGGSRILPQGDLSPRLAYLTALALASVALAAALALVLVAGTGPLTIVLIGAALCLSWFYSAPPFRLHSRGVGELVTALIVAVLTPCLGFYLQTGYLAAWLVPVLWPLFCLQISFQFSVNFPDAAADAAVGKRTLVVRYPDTARSIYLLVLALAYVAVPVIVLSGLPPEVAAGILMLSPIAVWLFWRAIRGALTQPRHWSTTSFATVLLLILTAVMEAAAFMRAGR
jgi:1,4-dihydroxy-2-naphthoate octaprenyltransferase